MRLSDGSSLYWTGGGLTVKNELWKRALAPGAGTRQAATGGTRRRAAGGRRQAPREGPQAAGSPGRGQGARGRSQAAGGTGRHHSAAASQKGGPFFGHPLSTDLSWRSQKWDRKTAPILRLFSAPWLTKRTSPEANFCSMHREKKGALRRRVFCCATVWTRHCRAATRACAACAAAAFGHGFAVCGNPSRDVFKAGGWLTPLHTDSLRRRRRSESCRA